MQSQEMGNNLNIPSPTITFITELILAREDITVKNQTKKQVIGTVHFIPTTCF